MIGFAIWSIVAVFFLFIGISSWKSEKAVGFFTGVEPPKVTDVKAYNHAVGKIWFVSAILLEIAGIPLLFSEQNTAIVLLMIPVVIILIIAMVIVYLKVELKYRK